jgi:hypothetical protein
MAREENFYCDFCGKEVWGNNCAAVQVFATQKVNGFRNKIDFEKIYWQHKKEWEYLICEECAGENITANHGHDHRFDLAEAAKNLLVKLGFVRSSTDPKMEIVLASTERGFIRGKFTDLYGVGCSIQQSSLADDNAIWLGVDDAAPQIMARDAASMGREDLLTRFGTERYNGWVKFPIPENVHLTTRMHLNQEQVASLLPLLQYFVEYGDLPTQAP